MENNVPADFKVVSNVPEGTQKLFDQSASALDLIEELVIEDEVMYEVAGTELVNIKTRYKDLEKIRKSITQPLDQAKKQVMDLFRVPSERFEKAERVIKDAMSGYEKEQERKRREEEKRIQAEQDRRRKEAEEEARKAEETARKADEAARAAEAAGNTAEAKKAAEAAAESARIALENRVVADTEVKVTVPVTQTAKPKGVGTRKVWKFEVEDPNLVPREYLVVDEKKIRGVVNALHENAKIPGVRVYEDTSISVRT